MANNARPDTDWKTCYRRYLKESVGVFCVFSVKHTWLQLC